MSSQRGFTLIEVLIAVTVFAVLAAAAYVSLNALSDAAFTQRQRSAELAELQRGLARLDADLRQLASRPVRSAAGDLEPALLGDGAGLTATRAGWANPQAQRRSDLQRFAWQLSGEGLTRISWPVTDRTAAVAPFQELVLSEIEDLEFAFMNQAGVWVERWPEEAAPGALPRAVRYRLDSVRFGAIERIVVLP
ncbi:MAG: type II secretion system minor pseudopilin GspJ [Wenzhouxiangella sp.]